jgi:hypothetical protein
MSAPKPKRSPALASAIVELVRQHGIDAVRAEVAVHKKRVGAPPKKEDDEGVVIWIEVEIERRKSRMKNLSTVCKRLCERDGGTFEWITDDGKVRKLTPATLRRLYYDANKNIREDEAVYLEFCRHVDRVSEIYGGGFVPREDSCVTGSVDVRQVELENGDKVPGLSARRNARRTAR